MSRRSRITYSRESLLTVAFFSDACRDNRLPAGVDANVLRLMAGSLFIDRSGHHHHQKETIRNSSSSSSSGLLWRPKVTTAPPEDPSDVPPLQHAPESFQTGDWREVEPRRCHRIFSTDDSSSNQQDVAKMSNLAAVPPNGIRGVVKMPNAGTATPASIGASATAKISVDASLTGAIIGFGGATIKLIARVTGAKVVIRDHASDVTLKNVELEGTFDQIKDAGSIVLELIASAVDGGGGGGDAAPPATGGGPQHHGGITPGSKLRTRLCEHFARGWCFRGDRCRFAHGEDQLRSPGGRSDVDATLNFWAHDEFPSRKGGW